MKTFKVVVLKWTQNFTLIRKAESEFQLKEDLHKEGFSVWSIEELQESEISWNKYYFDVRQNGTIKTWTISSQDIFRSYIKIKYELNYDLVYLYYTPETPLEEKQKIIHDLEEQYKIYLEVNKKELQKEKEKNEEKISSTTIKEESIDSFQMKKEIEWVTRIIERVLVKMKGFIEIPDNDLISYEKREKLKAVYEEVNKLKTSTNIYKLKEIWELWLIKVWEIELSILETKKSEEVRKLLAETNKLLKSVGSKESFIEKEKDIGYLLEKWVNSLLDGFKKEKKRDVEILDKQSNAYTKTKVLYNKYEKKSKEVQLEILKNIHIFLIPTKENQKKSEYLLLKQKVIKQNMMILKAKLTKPLFSYTKIVKWYDTIVQKILDFLYYLRSPLYVFIFIYSALFIFLESLKFYWGIQLEVNYNGIFYFLLLLFFYIFVHFSKWLVTLIFNFVIFSFIFIVWVINF